MLDNLWSCADQKDIPADKLQSAKQASTHFKFISYSPNFDHSIVKCYPKTGRTHQIRVHLQSLGFPIANDQMYGGTVLNYMEKDPKAVALDSKDFANSFQTDEGGTSMKMFVVLWLHAYKY